VTLTVKAIGLLLEEHASRTDGNCIDEWVNFVTTVLLVMSQQTSKSKNFGKIKAANDSGIELGDFTFLFPSLFRVPYHTDF
jgi:hypothetical protein